MGDWSRGRVEWRQSWVKWACGQGTDSPATPLAKAITASTTSHNCPQQQNQVIEEVGETRKVEKQTRWKHMGFSPINQGLTPPTPYPLEPCPFDSTLHCRSWLWVYNYLMCVFTWCLIIRCRIARHTIGNYTYCRNIHTHKSMVGLFPLAPHHD